MRLSWVHPAIAEAARAALRLGKDSWAEVFSPDDGVLQVAPPEGVDAATWPQVAEHVARAERVREVVAQGLEAARSRFGSSSHAVEQAALVEAEVAAAEAAGTPAEREGAGVLAVLACPVDEHLAYGHFLSRLVELEAVRDPAGTVLAFERFVAAARAVKAVEPSWPERLRVAEDGLGALYVRVGRIDDAEALFDQRFASEPDDATVAITAARAFLEHGDVAHAVAWLERGSTRARASGRASLADTLDGKAKSLRARLS
jgi:tetratricopeptide (TPR) repeat protein